jgi:alanine racemase
MPRPTYAQVDLGAIRHNLRALRALLAPRVKVLGVVKADAYGHGAARVARTLQDAGIDMLAVALVEEGVLLRRAGIRAPILVMGTLPADDMDAALAHNLRVTVADLATAAALQRRAAARRRRAVVHLKIDTGMSRMGFRPEEAAAAARTVAAMKRLVLEGAYTHFACADEDGHLPGRQAGEATGRQLARLRRALAAMRDAGVRPPLVHAANSSALITMPAAHFNMVRPGLALYGVRPCPAAAKVRLTPALTLKTQVAHLKAVRPGEGVSYGHRWKAKRNTLLGLLPIGYADGYPRALWHRGKVRVAGRLCPIRGVICMDATLVDLTAVSDPHVGMPATLIEADPAGPLSAESLARLCGTIPYEILTGIGSRVPRVYADT